MLSYVEKVQPITPLRVGRDLLDHPLTGEEIIPIILSLVNKKLKVLLQFLIDSFHLPISLGMVCSSGSQLNSKESVQFLCKFHHKLGSPIGHNSPRQSVVFLYVLKVELGSSSGSQGSDCAHKVATLGDRVNYYHDGIFPIRFQEFNYKIDTGSVPRHIRNREGV